jgi:hypothetical protein
VARALRAGHLSLADFTPQAVQRYADDPLLSRVTMLSYSADEERVAQDKLPHIATVKLHDGRVRTVSRNYAVGSLQEPFTDADRLGKFMDCCGSLNNADSVYESLLALDDTKNLKALKLMFNSATS